MICALDTNLLAYAEGLNGVASQAEALAVLDQLGSRGRLPMQVVAEIYNLLSRQTHGSRRRARSSVLDWLGRFPLLESPDSTVLPALELAAEHQLTIWDAMVVAVAQAGNCVVLLSEDLQHGFQWRGLTVINPFARPRHSLLTSLLALN